MENFDLKKFLVENKLTKNAKLLSESVEDESVEDESIEDESIEDEEFFIELEDYLVNKALDTGKITDDQKNAWRKTHIKLTYRVETPDLNYSLVLGTTFEFNEGDFQGDYVGLENFDNVGPKWKEYEDEFDYLEDVDVDSLNRKTQLRLDKVMEDLKRYWYEDYFDN